MALVFGAGLGWAYAYRSVVWGWFGAGRQPVQVPPRVDCPVCPEAEEPTPELGDAGVHWLPLEQLEHMEGPWRTTDGEVLVSLADRGSEGPGFPAQLWRLTVEWSSGPLIVCTMYEALQYGDPPTRGMPWRLGYCRGRAVVSSEEPALATRVILLRVPKQEYLRLVLGTELDVDIYQVQ